MNTVDYKTLATQYRVRQIMKLFTAAVVMIVMFFAASVIPVAGLAAMIAFIYLLMEGIKAFILSLARRKGNKVLKNKGLWNDAMTAMENAVHIQVDKQCFAVTDKYLFLPYGMILELNRIAWVYMQIQTTRFFYIPVMKMNICQFKLLDETTALAFCGKVKDMEAFKKLLLVLKLQIPELLIGYTGENQKMYQKMVAEHKKLERENGNNSHSCSVDETIK